MARSEQGEPRPTRHSAAQQSENHLARGRTNLLAAHNFTIEMVRPLASCHRSHAVPRTRRSPITTARVGLSIWWMSSGGSRRTTCRRKRSQFRLRPQRRQTTIPIHVWPSVDYCIIIISIATISAIGRVPTETQRAWSELNMQGFN
jgi:hypothetical protein